MLYKPYGVKPSRRLEGLFSRAMVNLLGSPWATITTDTSIILRKQKKITALFIQKNMFFYFIFLITLVSD